MKWQIDYKWSYTDTYGTPLTCSRLASYPVTVYSQYTAHSSLRATVQNNISSTFHLLEGCHNPPMVGSTPGGTTSQLVAADSTACLQTRACTYVWYVGTYVGIIYVCKSVNVYAYEVNTYITVMYLKSVTGDFQFNHSVLQHDVQCITGIELVSTYVCIFEFSRCFDAKFQQLCHN